MGDTFAVMATLEQGTPTSAVIEGAGYTGLEMADALTVRGLAVTKLSSSRRSYPPLNRSSYPPLNRS